MDTPNPTATPDITAAQITAVIQAVIAVAVAFGLSITKEQQTAILGLSAVIGFAITFADAHIRHGRAIAVGQAAASGNPLGAAAPAPPTPPTPPAT